jgi:hypothetical protein
LRRPRISTPRCKPGLRRITEKLDYFLLNAIVTWPISIP